MHGNVLSIVADVRNNVFEKVNTFKLDQGNAVDNFTKETQQNQQNLIHKLQKEVDLLNEIIIKTRQFGKLRVFQMTKDFKKKLNTVNEESDKIKWRSVNTTLHFEEKQILISQQKVALKKQLALLDVEFNNLKVKLNKEVCQYLFQKI